MLSVFRYHSGRWRDLVHAQRKLSSPFELPRDPEFPRHPTAGLCLARSRLALDGLGWSCGSRAPAAYGWRPRLCGRSRGTFAGTPTGSDTGGPSWRPASSARMPTLPSDEPSVPPGSCSGSGFQARDLYLESSPDPWGSRAGPWAVGSYSPWPAFCLSPADLRALALLP